jgi:hypothetical protein
MLAGIYTYRHTHRQTNTSANHKLNSLPPCTIPPSLTDQSIIPSSLASYTPAPSLPLPPSSPLLAPPCNLCPCPPSRRPNPPHLCTNPFRCLSCGVHSGWHCLACARNSGVLCLWPTGDQDDERSVGLSMAAVDQDVESMYSRHAHCARDSPARCRHRHRT